MSSVQIPPVDDSTETPPRRRRLTARFATEPSQRTAVLYLVVIAAVLAALRAALVTRVQAPTVFSDEIGYMELAQSIGIDGRLALFNDPGLSYSPLYPALIAPIYALGASVPTAYELVKVMNAVLLALSLFPTYAIARFVLPRRLSVLVAGLAGLAPVMTYSSFTMSENLAYPLCLVAIWAMLNTVQRPSLRADVLLMVAIALATAARIQLVVLVPAALTAILLAAMFEPASGTSRRRRVVRAVRAHWLPFGLVGAALLIAAVASIASVAVLDVFGRYANVGRRGFPNLWDLLELFVRHLAGVDLAVGVVPFVGALVAGYIFMRSSGRHPRYGFAAVAVSVTTWLLLEVAIDAALFDTPEGDIPRIHERFLIYVLPFFLVALLAVYQAPASRASENVYRGAVAVAALLPAAIPFGTVVNQTISFESLGLHPFARVVDGRLSPVPHATLVAIFFAAVLGLLYVTVRARLRSIVILLLLPFIYISGIGRTRVESSSEFARSLLPEHADWVDRAATGEDVVLLTGDTSTIPELQTAYHNLSIKRLYYLCGYAFGAEFGETFVTIDRAGVLRDRSGDKVTAAYVVAPTSLRARGRVVARNTDGREVLLAARGGVVAVAPEKRSALDCTRRQAPGVATRESARLRLRLRSAAKSVPWSS